MAPHTPPSLSSLAQMPESIERTAHLSSNQWQGGYHVSTWVGSSHHSSSFIRIPNPQSPSLSSPHLPSPPHLLLAAAAIDDAAAAASICPSFRSSLTTACRCRGAVSRVLSLKQRVCVEGSITRDPTVHRRPLPNSAQKEGGGGGHIQPTPRDSPRSQSWRCRWTGCAGRGGSSTVHGVSKGLDLLLVLFLLLLLRFHLFFNSEGR